jgi:adenine-specific DNA-methyltransferase
MASMLQKRLKLAKRLLNPKESVLIATIDEKEYLRLGMLFEQVFTGSNNQMVSTLINPASVAREGAFGRNDEYIFFVTAAGFANSRTSEMTANDSGNRGKEPSARK